MHKLLVFDLDGTLAALGKGMLNRDIELLRELEEMGYVIAICSGKPTYYLCGFMRQVGIKYPIMIGENGAAYQFGVDLPPEKHYLYPYSEKARLQLKKVKDMIDAACDGQIWYQPNEVAVTPFPQDAEMFAKIQDVLNTYKDELDELVVFRHVDSFDITPKNINKSNGLAYLSDLIEIDRKDIIAVGDWVNDIPMFEYADCSICVGGRLDYPTDYSFDTIKEVLSYIIEQKL